MQGVFTTPIVPRMPGSPQGVPTVADFDGQPSQQQPPPYVAWPFVGGPRRGQKCTREQKCFENSGFGSALLELCVFNTNSVLPAHFGTFEIGVGTYF